MEVAVPRGRYDAHAAAAWLDLKADHRTNVEFNFDRGHSVRGRLIDKRGHPVTDREVSFSEPTEPPLDLMIARARTDSRGSFRIHGLPRRRGSLAFLIPQHPERGYSQAVALQYQVVEDVMPGSPPVEIVVREFNAENPTMIVIGGGA